MTILTERNVPIDLICEHITRIKSFIFLVNYKNFRFSIEIFLVLVYNNKYIGIL